MIRLGFILALCICGSLAYNIAHDLEAMDREWSRGMPGTVVTGGGGGSSECKKDMWIVWDNSWSVGENSFKDKVRPFLKALISSPQLNVGPDGTHIGIITFSTQAQTKVLLELGELQTAEQLENFLDGLKYSQISGDGTRTGMALKMADEKFPKASPGNYRPDVSDVVLIFTDGEPIRRRGEDQFGEKYKGNEGEGLLANDRAKSLRDKDVTVVGLAVGTEYTLSRFRDEIKGWTTEGKYFETSKDSLSSIMNELISASCIDPGECGCSGGISAEAYVAEGGKASINWVKPNLKCDSGRQAIIDSESVQPPGITPPSEFGAGRHTITYTYNYLRGTKVATLQCPIAISVITCGCKNIVRVNAQLPAGSNTASVSWQVPQPDCPATLISVSPPGAKYGQGNFPIGVHDVLYKYERRSITGNFLVRCPVQITVKGHLCGGVGFDPTRQVCCCGTVHDRKANHDCCGPKYYDTRYQRCADYYTLVDN